MEYTFKYQIIDNDSQLRVTDDSVTFISDKRDVAQAWYDEYAKSLKSKFSNIDVKLQSVKVMPSYL